MMAREAVLLVLVSATDGGGDGDGGETLPDCILRGDACISAGQVQTG